MAEDFFKDLQEEFSNWDASVSSQGKPKSLWEELAVRVAFKMLLNLEKTKFLPCYFFQSLFLWQKVREIQNHSI